MAAAAQASVARLANPADSPEAPPRVVAPGQGTPAVERGRIGGVERGLSRPPGEMSSQPPPSEAPRAPRVIPVDLEHLGRDTSARASMVGPASQDLRAVAVERGSGLEQRPAIESRPPLESRPALEPRPALEDTPPLVRPPASFGRGRQSSEGPPIVEISIGEIEVRPAPAPPPARVHASERAPFRPPMSLEEYLRRRAAGGR